MCAAVAWAGPLRPLTLTAALCSVVLNSTAGTPGSGSRAAASLNELWDTLEGDPKVRGSASSRDVRPGAE